MDFCHPWNFATQIFATHGSLPPGFLPSMEVCHPDFCHPWKFATRIFAIHGSLPPGFLPSMEVCQLDFCHTDFSHLWNFATHSLQIFVFEKTIHWKYHFSKLLEAARAPTESRQQALAGRRRRLYLKIPSKIFGGKSICQTPQAPKTKTRQSTML